MYKYVKKNNDLSVITNIANASLFSIRNRCPVYAIKMKHLSAKDETVITQIAINLTFLI